MGLLVASISYSLSTIAVLWWCAQRARGAIHGQGVQTDRALAARFIYMLSYLIVFVGVTAIIALGGELGSAILEELQAALNLPSKIKSVLSTELVSLSPLFSLAFIYFSLKVDIVRAADQRILAWLHSTDHLDDELAKVRLALENNSFLPSDIEIEKNRKKLKQYHVRISDNRLLRQDVEFVSLWRKVACLISRVKEWQESDLKVLNSDEEKELSEIEETHDRKTAHAMDIIRAMDHYEHEAMVHPSEQAIAAALSGSYMPNRHGGLHDRPPPQLLDIGSEEFATVLKKIQRYFLSEYDILIQKVSALAAKSVVYSGPESSIRWDNLREAGYQDLQDMHRLSVDKIMKLICATIVVVCFSSIIFYMITTNSGPGPMQIVKNAIIISFAVLCGAIVGTSRVYRKRSETPWTAFIGSGAMSFFLFMFVQFSFAVSELFFKAVSKNLEPFAGGIMNNFFFGWIEFGGYTHDLVFGDIIPWAVMPVAASVGICWISRLSSSKQFSSFSERVLDGLSLSAIFFLAAIFTFSVHNKFNTRVSEFLHHFSQERLQIEEVYVAILIFSGFLAFIGFAVGSVVIADIRKIAKLSV